MKFDLNHHQHHFVFFLSGVFKHPLEILLMSRGPRRLTSRDVPAPLCCSPSVASNFTLSPPPLCSIRFLLCPPPTPTSTHVRSCILHLHHHIRPVLFLHSSLIYIPPSPSLSSPPSLLFLPFCFVLSGSLSAPKKSLSLHWAPWYRLSSPLFLVQALEQ